MDSVKHFDPFVHPPDMRKLRHNPGIADAGDRVNSGPQHGPSVPPSIGPRLLDLDGAAAYLSMSPWTVREIPADRLPRVRLAGKDGRDIRRILFDRVDLDRFIEASKS